MFNSSIFKLGRYFSPNFIKILFGISTSSCEGCAILTVQLNPTGNDAARVKVREQIGKSVFVLEGYPISSIHGYPDKNDLHIHAAMVKHNIDYLVTNDKALLDYWETSENTDEPLPYVTISADDLLMDFVEPHLGRSTQESLTLSSTDLAEIYLFQERYFIKKYGEADLCGALERAEAPRFAAYLRRHMLPRLP